MKEDLKRFFKLVFSIELIKVLIKGCIAYIGIMLSVGSIVELIKGKLSFEIPIVFIPFMIVFGIALLFAVFGYFNKD